MQLFTLCHYRYTVVYNVLQGICSVYEKFEGELGGSKVELVEAYQKLMTLFQRLAFVTCHIQQMT